MRLLLDTCAISELRRTECKASARRLIESIRDEDLFISVITLGEIRKGISLLATSSRKRDLENWFSALERAYAERILPITRDIARIWGELSASCQQQGRQLAAGDGLIAATAMFHGLHVLTRNSRDFELTGALVVDPWQS